MSQSLMSTSEAKSVVFSFVTSLAGDLSRIVSAVERQESSENVNALADRYEQTRAHLDAALAKYLWLKRGDELAERLPKLEAEAARCREVREGIG